MPQGISCSAPGGGHFQDSPPDRMECSQSLRSPRRWERGVGHLAKWGSPGGGLESQHGGHMGIPKVGGVPNTVGGGGGGGGLEDLPQTQHRMVLSALEGERPPPQRKARDYRTSPLPGRTCR